VAVEELRTIARTLPKGMIRFLTIVGQYVVEGDKYFSIARLGYTCFDSDQSAHVAYSVSPANGAVVVLRPDGLLAYATTLDNVGGVAAFLGNLSRDAQYRFGLGLLRDFRDLV
jgi:phenol 2-monooxygenase